MYPVVDPTASPAMITPSITACGSCSKMSRSLQVPGSLSSPLQRMYLGLGDCLGTNDHFKPVLNPAPPRPLLVHVRVHLHSRRPTACADTFYFFEREQPVGGRALVSDAKLLFAMFKKLFATAQHAGNIGADLDVEFAARLGRQHGVIADYVADLEFSQFEPASNFGDHVVGQVPNLILCIQQRRY